MKEMSNSNGMSFAGAFKFSTVNAGQRQVTYAPQFIATSTEGGFRITPPISRILNLQAGDYLAFANTIDSVDAAIRDNNPMLVEFCANLGLDITSTEALVAIHREFDQWVIYKGVKELDPKGNVKVSAERLTKRDRVKFVENNFDMMLNAALTSGDENLVAALNAEGVTRDAQVELLCPFVQARELPKFQGSKLGNPANLTGTGVVLTFTDSNVWAQLKGDLGENASKVNRVFEVNINPDAIVKMTTFNGYEEVLVNALVLGKYVDETVTARIAKANDEEAGVEEAE